MWQTYMYKKHLLKYQMAVIGSSREKSQKTMWTYTETKPKNELTDRHHGHYIPPEKPGV